MIRLKTLKTTTHTFAQRSQNTESTVSRISLKSECSLPPEFSVSILMIKKLTPLSPSLVILIFYCIDMLNHRRPKQTTWSYSQVMKGFIIESLEDIPIGTQVFDSYGKKCNSRFLLNYGFYYMGNEESNEVPIYVFYNENDEFKKVKQKMIKDENDYRKFRVKENLNDTVMIELFSWLRFVEYDDNITILYQYQN
jgi:hypothetical protein